MIRKALRDPLAHFLLAGAAIWGALALIGDPVDPASRTITLSRERQAGIALGFERMMGRPPTDAELDAAIARWVREEVLYREALRLGLDEGDAVVRRRLATKMDELAGAEAETTSVPDTTLGSWLHAHPERFSEGARFTFSQEFYPDEETLHEALDGEGPSDGHPTGLPRRLKDASYAEIAAVFGSDFATGVAQLRPSSGAQINSGYGFHILELEARVEGRTPPLSEIRERVEADWRSATIAARRARAYDLLREAYRVEIE